jgi:hypothetical protein
MKMLLITKKRPDGTGLMLWDLQLHKQTKKMKITELSGLFIEIKP